MCSWIGYPLDYSRLRWEKCIIFKLDLVVKLLFNWNKMLKYYIKKNFEDRMIDKIWPCNDTNTLLVFGVKMNYIMLCFYWEVCLKSTAFHEIFKKKKKERWFSSYSSIFCK